MMITHSKWSTKLGASLPENRTRAGFWNIALL